MCRYARAIRVGPVVEPFLERHLALACHGVEIRPMDTGLVPELWSCLEPDPSTFQWFTERPADWTFDAFRAFMDRRMSAGFLCHAVLVEGKCVGSTTLFDIRREHRGVEIGFTFYGHSFRGTKLNPVCKWLLIKHMIEVEKAHRVQLKTDMRNLASRKAMEKLGFVHEGILRNACVMPDGHLRETTYYSVIPTDWPAVEARLLDWIARKPEISAR